MQIVENNAQRVTLVEDMGLGDILGHSMALVGGTLFAAIGSAMLFAEVSELVVPGWAESMGWSDARWHMVGVAGFNWSEGGMPGPHAVSLVMSLLLLVLSLMILETGTRVLFTTRQRLVLDFGSGPAILTRKGLFRCKDRTHPFADISAWLEDNTDENGEPYQDLIVSAAGSQGDRGKTGPRTGRTTLWRETITSEQGNVADRLIRVFTPSLGRTHSSSAAQPGT